MAEHDIKSPNPPDEEIEEQEIEESDVETDDSEDYDGSDEEHDYEDEDEETEEDDSLPTVDSLEMDDPLLGPAAIFIDEIIKNASIPIESRQLGVYLSVITDEDEENDDSEDGPEAEIEEIVTVQITTEQRIGILRANVEQLMALLRTKQVDFEFVTDVRENIMDEDGEIPEGAIESDGSEEDEDRIDTALEYIDYIQRIVPGAKALYQEDPDGVAEVLIQLLDWSVQKDIPALYEDISKCGAKITKKIMWMALHRNQSA